jgi:spore germination cell wall hydrolase CwlJ-like protein
MTFSEHVATRTLWMEARGEPEAGQRAVAHVLINRVKDGRWGHNLASVCLAPYQFSCWLPNDPNIKSMAAVSDGDPMLAKLGGFLRDAMAGEADPTKGATHYYAESMMQPPLWSRNKPFVAIGRHRFFAGIA